MAGRGILTPEISSLAKKLLGHEIDVTELRLMPYVQYVMINEQKLDLNKINEEDRSILSKWRKKEFITGGASHMTVTKKFWDAMNEIIYLSYVDRD